MHIFLEIKKQKVVYFVNRTDTIAECCKMLINSGSLQPEEIAVIVSRNRIDEMNEKLETVLTEKQAESILKASEETYESIVKTHQIPENCRILLSTSTLREGVNIKNTDIYMVCESHVLSDLIQFFGRARLAGCTVDIVNDVAAHPIMHNELLYLYAIENECMSANAFMYNQVTVDPTFLLHKENFIRYVKKNPYLDYNYIKEKFEVLVVLISFFFNLLILFITSSSVSLVSSQINLISLICLTLINSVYITYFSHKSLKYLPPFNELIVTIKANKYIYIKLRKDI
mgnify:CR=1 FL=1